MQYWKLQNSEGKCWLIPTKNTKVALEIYQPTNWKGKLLKWLLPLFSALKWLYAPFPIVNEALNGNVLNQLKSIFNADDIEISVFLGTPSVHQKTVIQLFKGQKIIGYAKLSSKKEVKALFDNEARLLNELQRKGVTNIPRCLCNQQMDDSQLFVMTTIKTISSKSNEQWSDLHEAFLNNLYEKTTVDINFEDSDYYRKINNLLVRLDDVPDCIDQQVLKSAIDNILQTYKGKTMPMAFMHGDFTPWNMFVEGGQLFVFDWEYALRTCPIGLDKYHFILLTAFFVKHLSAEQAKNFLQNSACKWVNKDQLKLYLALIIAIFVCRESGKTKTTPLFKWWGNLLTI